MTWQDTALSVALVAGAAAVGIWAIKSYLIDPASEAGEWVGEHVLTPIYWTSQYPITASQGIIEGYSPPYVPPTPEGYRPSNWSWEIGQGTVLGLPAGMTPGQFCAQNPGSPLCSQLGIIQDIPWWQDISLRW